MRTPFLPMKQTDADRFVIVYEGGKAEIHLIRTEQGFILDVYNKSSQNISTATIWDDDLDYPSDEEIDEFKKKWGQTHAEICTELDVPFNGSDDYLMDDYFWIPNDEIWCNKHASTFTEREQEIADYLIEVLSRVD